MSDYRVKITIRNERILKLIEDKGYISVKSFAEKNYLPYQQLTELVAGKLKPFTEKGTLVGVCAKLLEVLNVTLEDCFTERQLQGFSKRSFEIKVKEKDLKQIVNPTKNQEQKLIEEQAKIKIRVAIEKGLNPREAAILKMRFGFDDGHEHTLEEIAQTFHLSRERVRQIIGKAQRKMKHPQVMSTILGSGLKEAFDIVAPKHLVERSKNFVDLIEKKHGLMSPEEYLDQVSGWNNKKLN